MTRGSLSDAPPILGCTHSGDAVVVVGPLRRSRSTGATGLTASQFAGILVRHSQPNLVGQTRPKYRYARRAREQPKSLGKRCLSLDSRDSQIHRKAGDWSIVVGRTFSLCMIHKASQRDNISGRTRGRLGVPRLSLPGLSLASMRGRSLGTSVCATCVSTPHRIQ